MAADHSLIQTQAALARSQTVVCHLTAEEITALSAAAVQTRHGERDELPVILRDPT